MRCTFLAMTWMACHLLLFQPSANKPQAGGGLYSVAAEMGGLRQDTRLQKAVTLHLPDALLDEVARELGKQTGVAVTIDPALEEEKATLFVTGKPAWQVLEKLTALLDIRCENSGEGYRLSPDPQARQKEQAMLEWERDALRRDAEKMLRRWSRAAGEDYLSLMARKRTLGEEMERLEREKPPGWQDRRNTLSQQLEPLRESSLLPLYLAGWCYRRFPAAVWRRFWEGEILWFSTSGKPGVLPLPAESLRWATPGSPEPQKVLFGIRFDQQQARLVFYLKTRPIEPATDADFLVEDREIYPDASPAVPLPSRWEQWRTPEETFERDPRFQKEIRRSSSSVPALRGATTVADWLQSVAQHSGLNVVADSFRLPEPLVKQDGTLIEWLRSSPIWNAGYLRVEEDWLLFRHWRYWRWKRSELPERLVRAMERKAQEEGLSLDDYAILAASFTPEGMARLKRGEYAMHLDHAPLQSAAPALRFWASLTANQKKAALQRQPVLYTQLTPSQQNLFREAMLTKLYEEPNEILFDALNNPESQPEFAFVVDRWREDAYTLTGEGVSITTESPEELEQQRHLVPGATDEPKQSQTEQMTLYFGIDTRRSVRYELSIHRKPPLFSSSK